MRPIALHMSPEIAAQLRGGSAHCALVAMGGISDSLDLTVMPTWSVPPSWTAYTVHLVINHLNAESLFNQTTQRFTIPANATQLTNLTDNALPYTFSNFWTSHDDYDSDNDIAPLASAVSLIVTGVMGSGALVQQVFSVVGVQRLPGTSQIQLDSVHIVDAGPTPTALLNLRSDEQELPMTGGALTITNGTSVSFEMYPVYTGGVAELIASAVLNGVIQADANNFIDDFPAPGFVAASGGSHECSATGIDGGDTLVLTILLRVTSPSGAVTTSSVTFTVTVDT